MRSRLIEIMDGLGIKDIRSFSWDSGGAITGHIDTCQATALISATYGGYELNGEFLPRMSVPEFIFFCQDLQTLCTN